MWLYIVIQAGAMGSRVLPLSWRYRMSIVIADFMWLLWHSKRRTCIDNMAVVLGGSPGDRRVRRAARAAFRQFGKGVVDFLGFANIDPKSRLLSQMPVKGWDHIEEALARGKGLIVASGHFGSTDMGGIALATRTPEFCAVADTFHPAYVDRLIRKTREQKGFHLIPTNAIREIIRALHRNAMVVMLFDRPMPLHEGVPVVFFGRQTALPAGPAVIALRTGASIVPAYIFREPDNSYRGRAFPDVTTNLTGDKDRDIATIMQRIADTLEVAIRDEPEQWYMFRPMWSGLVQPEPGGRTSGLGASEAIAG